MFPPLARLFGGLLTAVLVLLASACTTTVDVRPFEIPTFPPPPDAPRFYWELTLRSGADVEEDSKEDKFMRMVTGRKKTGEGLGKPYGIAVSMGRVFVGDTAARSVAVFDFPKKRFFRIGRSGGPGQLGKPLGVAVDSVGNVYVVDATARNIKIYAGDGRYITTVAKTGDLLRPTGVAVAPDASKLFVVDTGGVGSSDHRVRVYNPSTGEHLYDIGTRGNKDGEFNLPNNIAVGKNGLLYVVDGANFRVQVFTQEGKYLRSFGGVGRQPGMFSRPKGIATDGDNNVYVVDAAFGNFQIFDPEGQLLMFIGARSRKGGPAEYFLPAGIAVDEDGRVYVVDQFFKKVDVFRPARLKPEEGFLKASRKIVKPAD